MKLYPMTIKEEVDQATSAITRQEVAWEDDNFHGHYIVKNLSSTPEVAIIGEELFDAYDFINAIRFGIALAKKGYDGIEEIDI